METTATQDVQVESSPAIPARNTPAYTEWRQTGKLPEPKEDSTTSSSAGDDTAGGKPAPASETGKGTQDNKKPRADGAAARLSELLEDLRNAGLTPAELKTFKREAQQQQQQKAEPDKPAPEHTEKPAPEAKAPVRPKKAEFFDNSKYKSYEEAETAYEEALDKYQTDLADFRAESKLREYVANQQVEAGRQAVATKMEEARGRYGDDGVTTISSAARAITSDQQIPQAVRTMLDQSPVWPDLLFTLGGKAEDLAGFVHLAKTNPGEAIRKMVLMEHLITEELAKGGKAAAAAAPGGDRSTERDESGKFTKANPEKKESKAPPPPAEVSGRGTPPPDEVESAVKNNDVRGFFRAQNAKDLQRRRG